MRRHKRYTASLASALGLVALLTGAMVATGAASTSSPRAANKKVAIVAAVQNPTQVTEMCAAKQVLKKAGYDVSIQYPSNYDPAIQIPILNAVLNTRPAGLLISPDDPKALIPPIKRAVSQGMKVVTIDTSINNAAAAGVSSAISTNDVAAGAGAADLVGKATKGRKGEVALLTYSPGAAKVADDRSRGFQRAIKKYKHLRFIGVTVADNKTDAAAKTNALLASHPKLIAILGDWTGAAEGMLQALRQRNATKRVVGVGNDADDSLIEAIRKGYLYGSVFPTIPRNGTIAGQQLLNALTGKKTTPVIRTTPVTATRANIADPKITRFFLKTSCKV